MNAPQDRRPDSASATLPLPTGRPGEPPRPPLHLAGMPADSARDGSVFDHVDPIRAVFALAIGASATAYLYTVNQLPLILMVALATVAFDRLLGVIVAGAKQGARNWRERGRRAEPDPWQPPPPTSVRRPEPELRYPPAVAEPRPAQRQPHLQPVAFVAETHLGTLPWRLPQAADQSGVAADQALVGDLELRAASVVGPAHRTDQRKARHRQDAYRAAPAARGKYLITAVADGVSGAALSHVGANHAAEIAVRRIQEVLDRCPDLAQLRADQVFPEVADQLVKLADGWQRSPADFATTLVIAVIPTSTRNTGGRRVWLGWLADSSAWQVGERWRQLAGDVKPDYDQNALSACLPHHPKHAKHLLHVLPHGATLALMTDGLSDLLVDVEGSADELRGRWSAPPSLPELVRDMCFDAPGQDDDRTVVLVYTPERIRAVTS